MSDKDKKQDDEDLKKEIHESYKKTTERISVDDKIALDFGRSVLGKKITQSELIEKARLAKKSNALSTKGKELTFRIRLMASGSRFLSKRERDKIREVLDEYDKLENSN